MCLPVYLQILLLVALQTVEKGSSYEYNRTIFVSHNGTLNNSCWSEVSPEWPCASLDVALQGAETFTGFVQILIEPGQYNLTESIVFQGKSSLSVLGHGNEAVVECHPLAGIAFNRSTNILMENLSFVGCGARHLSTSRNFTSSSLPYLYFQVALLFLVSKDITLTKINVHSSNGTGVAFLNIFGDIVITDSMIVNNTANGTGNLPGGGGIYVEFSQCITPALNLSNATYNITGCHFNGNEASTGEFEITHHLSPPWCENQFSFGRGGGLAIFFKEGAKDNYISLTNCSFHSNRAMSGAGVQVSIEDGSQNNTVKVASSTFVWNICYKQVVPPSNFSTGGGAALFFFLYPENETNSNNIVFEFCNFTQNEAYQGGGIAFLSTSVDSKLAFTNVAEFNGCNFESNFGRVGAAVNVFHWLSFSSMTANVAIPKFRNCRFCENGGVYTYLQGNVTGRTFATVYVEGIPTYFSGSIVYYRNKGSALVVQATSIEFASNASVSFIENHGRIGGAMAILGNSWIVVNEGAQLTFESNVASEKGGAIFVIQTEQHSTAYSHTCFIRYFDPYCPPQNWTSKFIFSNNTAFNRRRNSIHMSSLLPCTWPQNPTSPIEYDINQTFCSWNGWEFKDLKPNSTCADEILTSPVRLAFNKSKKHNLFPGRSKALHIQALDELNHNVTNQTIFTVSLLEPSVSADLDLLYVSNDSLTVDWPPNTQADISLETFDTIAVSLELEINILPCPPGFVYNRTEKRCKCGQGFRGLVHCKSEKFRSYLEIGGCISFNKSDGFPIAAHCPFSDLESTEFIPLPKELNDSFCGNISRRGRLCSKCKAGYGVAVYSPSFKCVKCKESYTNWLRYFAMELVPLTIFFLIVLTFHISITSAATNAFIFFSQVISLPFGVLFITTSLNMLLNRSQLAKALSGIVIFPYSIWSLDFSFISGPNFCLSQSISVAHILVLQYISAVYPLVLSMLAYIIIELHARNFRPVVCLWRPLCLLLVRFRRTWQPKTSTMDAFAAFILLSYTKFVRVSLSLLTPSHVFNDSGNITDTVLRYDPSIQFFGRAHLPYAILAIFVLLTFGAIPPILLLLYPFRRFQRCLNRYRLLQSPALHMFIDTFQGCYKNGKERCFAGLYFVFRIVIFIIYTSLIDDLLSFFSYLVFAYVGMLVLFAIFQPYKQKFFNCLDVLMIALLLLINSLRLYAYVRLISSHERHRSYPHVSMVATYTLLFLPLTYMIGYVVHQSLIGSACCRKYCISKFKRTTPEGQPLTHSNGTRQRRREVSTSSEIPDRLENPHRYQDMSWSVKDTEIDDPLQGGTDADEHTSLTIRTNQVANYGTNTEPTH